MLKSFAILPFLAAVAVANAQSVTAPDPQATAPSQPAPVVRSYPLQSYHSALRQPRRLEDQIVESQPTPGVWLRSASTSVLNTTSATPQRTEVRLDRGRLNVTVHHPADHAEILVDLPGGQVSLFKDGLYTLNADTNTVRVLHGEAAAYPGPVSANANTKPVKIKEDHQLSLIDTAVGLKPVEAYPYELTADLLRPTNEDRALNEYDGGYPYPYYAGAWGYPYSGYYGYGYPFGYGAGFGYYGGFRGGFGYRGGFRR